MWYLSAFQAPRRVPEGAKVGHSEDLQFAPQRQWREFV